MGFCFTEHHVDAMHDHLSKQVYTDMQKEDSPLYQASMVIQLESKASDKKDEDDTGDDKTPNKKPKAKAQPKKKKKAETTPKGQPKKKAKKGNKPKEEGDDAELEEALKNLEGGDNELDPEEDPDEEEDEADE